MGGLDEFSKLSIDDQKRYRATSSQMTKFARDHAIPIAFAPPIGRFAVPVGEGKVGMVTVPLSLGAIAGATGCILRLQTGLYVVTAEHVLKCYEERVYQGEKLDWIVGRLRFDPLQRERALWRGSCKHQPKDIVFIEVLEREAEEACAGRTNLVSASTGWPAAAPEVGQTVLLAGYPNELRETDNGVVKPGSFSARLEVTTQTGDGTFKCRLEYSELLSFDEQPVPMKELRANVGGMSGGPVFAVEAICYPFVGVITQRGGGFGDFDNIVIEAVERVSSSFPI